MIDPFTALTVATTALGQIKQLTQAGQDCYSALSKFAGAVSDVNYAAEKAKNPSIWKTLTGSPEEEAIEIFAAQKKMEQMKRDVETLIGYTYGHTGLQEYKATLRKVREQRRQTEYRKQEMKEALLTWTIGILLFASGLAGFALVIYMIGVNQGKW